MRKYWLMFSNALQSLAEYRLSLLLDISGNIISSLVLYLFWRFLAEGGMDAGLYTTTTLGLYFLLVTTISTITGFNSHSVSSEIKDGEIVSFVLKPFQYMWAKFAASLPDKMIKLAVGALVFTLLLFFGVNFTTSPINIFFFLAALPLAIIGNFFLYFTVGLIAFWTRQTYGSQAIVEISSFLVSGRVVPLQLLPASIGAIANWLPFKYFLFFPVQIFLGQLTVTEIMIGLTTQLFWVGCLYFVSRLVWKAGQKELEAVGL